MKFCIPIFFICIVLLIACNQQPNSTRLLQVQIDSLAKKLNNTYKPGLGEFMSGIQVHHAKLWFAGQNKNWALANFEVGEIKESIDDIKLYCSDRPEVRYLPMIQGPIDSLSNAIESKNPELFKSNFMLLTQTCNNCHKATNHEFNVIKVPDAPPFSNQEFGAAK